MNFVNGKTVYILGAGASAHTGTPLMSKFLVSSRQLAARPQDLRFKEDFETIFKWIDGLRANRRVVDIDLDNIEHVFSLSEAMHQTREQGTYKRVQLRRVITETVDRFCCLQNGPSHYTGEPAYDVFASELAQVGQQRRDRIGETNYRPDTIITFNYDIALDLALIKTHRGIVNYCFSSETNPNIPRYLKLHGSINWLSCMARGCRDASWRFPLPARPADFKQPIEFHINTASRYQCPSCDTVGDWRIEIVPPTWAKTVENNHFQTIWQQAVDDLRLAEQIIFIGYSLPPSDSYIRYILAQGLSGSPRLRRIIVVDIDPEKGSVHNRYKDLFSSSARGDVAFVYRSENFRDYSHSQLNGDAASYE